jgi:hypothetical protein
MFQGANLLLQFFLDMFRHIGGRTLLWLRIGGSANANYNPFSLNTLTVPNPDVLNFFPANPVSEQKNVAKFS